MLPGEGDATVNFLRSKLKSQITIQGKWIQIDGNVDEVEFLIKKFLHQEGLDTYRVLSAKGVVRVVPEEKEGAYLRISRWHDQGTFLRSLRYRRNCCP